MAEVRMRHGIAFFLELADSAFYGAIRGAPAQYQQVSCCRTAVEALWRDMICDAGHFFFTDLYHQLVVLRIVTDIAGNIFFFQAPNTVFEPGSARYRPGSHQFLVPEVGLELFFVDSQFGLE